MNLKRPNKKLEKEIQLSVSKMRCPIHNKTASVKMDDENAETTVEACCAFFKKDVLIVAERMRKDFIYRAEKTREREERERRRRE
jgi:hypothetical protein